MCHWRCWTHTCPCGWWASLLHVHAAISSFAQVQAGVTPLSAWFAHEHLSMYIYIYIYSFACIASRVHSLLCSLSITVLSFSCCQANDPGMSKVCTFSPEQEIWTGFKEPRACTYMIMYAKSMSRVQDCIIIAMNMSMVHIARMDIGRVAWPWAYKTGWMYHDLPLDQDYLQVVGEQKEEDTLLSKAVMEASPCMQVMHPIARDIAVTQAARLSLSLMHFRVGCACYPHQCYCFWSCMFAWSGMLLSQWHLHQGRMCMLPSPVLLLFILHAWSGMLLSQWHLHHLWSACACYWSLAFLLFACLVKHVALHVPLTCPGHEHCGWHQRQILLLQWLDPGWDWSRCFWQHSHGCQCPNLRTLIVSIVASQPFKRDLWPLDLLLLNLQHLFYDLMREREPNKPSQSK